MLFQHIILCFKKRLINSFALQAVRFRKKGFLKQATCSNEVTFETTYLMIMWLFFII